jgi:eukaryotic-like serine/threonine-protein kinase
MTENSPIGEAETPPSEAFDSRFDRRYCLRGYWPSVSILPGHSQSRHEPDTWAKKSASDLVCLLSVLFGNQFLCPATVEAVGTPGPRKTPETFLPGVRRGICGNQCVSELLRGCFARTVSQIERSGRTHASSDPRDLGAGGPGMKQEVTRSGRPAILELQQIDAVCDRFEKAWLSKQRPDLAEFLVAVPAGLRAHLFRNLLRLDLEYGRERGELPDYRSYRDRFPDLEDVVATAFESHSSKPAAIRRARKNIARASTVNSPPRPQPDGDLQLGFFGNEPQGFNEAGYEILGELGRGGMGVVFKARQAALNRLVALKVVKSGRLASEAELIRFQNEAEAVAQLDHPHIVPIYEVGQCSGQHFFCMKLIIGTSLDRRTEYYASDPRATAKLVSVVARAVHHAHQRGILHRDLKPANVLVDEAGEPHVTDFGLAKRLEGGQEATHSGALLGTPSYMSPEQASGSRGAISTATDGYGLGTILYALLAGRAPFAGTTLVDTLEMVRNQIPERPSSLNSRVPRDLEVICLKCLEKEPQRRYQSALALAEDLERWLKGIPILAHPVRMPARVWMWCQRNRGLAAMAALLVLAVLGGIAGIAWKWREADHERTKTEAVNELLTRRLLSWASVELDPESKNLTVRELIDRASAQLGGWLEGQPEVEARIRETIGGVYLSLGQNEQAALNVEAAVRLDTELYGTRHRDTIRAVNLLTSLLDRTGQATLAETRARGNLETARAALGADDPTTLESGERLGTILWHLGKTDEAEALLRKNVDDRRRVIKAEHPDTLRSIYLLSRVLRERKSYAEAEQFAYVYAHSIQCSLGSNHPDDVLSLTNQADVYRDKGDLQQAERRYGQAARVAHVLLGANHPRTRGVGENHADVVRELRRHPGAQ